MATSSDYPPLSDLDPSIAEGHRVVYDREVPFELRVQPDDDSQTQEVGTLEAVKCKVLVAGEENNPAHVRVELSSESDLFFHYSHSVDAEVFEEMQRTQSLMISFSDYATVLMKMLNSCIKEPHAFLAIFLMSRDGGARLDIVQNMEYKFIELLSCDFQATSEEKIRDHITFRYNSIKGRLATVQARYSELSTTVKAKNPSLMLQAKAKKR